MSAEQPPHLEFEHLGPLDMGDRMVVADAACLSPRFEGLGRGALKLQMVLPVVTLRSPTTAAMSPAQTHWISSRLFACIFRRRPTRSRRDFATLKICEPAGRLPE